MRWLLIAVLMVPCGIGMADELPDGIEVVIAEGVGVDVEGARRDSYRNAVRQVVGAYVDAETIVKNDEVISDEIVILSPAFVDRIEPIPGSEQKQDGLVRVRVRAFVKITQLLEALAKEKIKAREYTRTVDSGSLMAEFQTKTARQQSQGEIIKKILENYPEGSLLLNQTAKPQVRVDADGQCHLDVQVSLTPNVDAYRVFTTKLCTALSANDRPQGFFNVDGLRFGPDSTAAKQRLQRRLKNALTDGSSLLGVFPKNLQETIRKQCDPQGLHPQYQAGPLYYLWDGNPREGIDTTYYELWQKLRENARTHYVVVCLEDFDDDFRRTKWRWFLVSEDERDTWFKTLPKGLTCHAAITNDSGNELAKSDLNLSKIGVWEAYPRMIWLLPFAFDKEMCWYAPDLHFPISFLITESDIPSIKEISTSVLRCE